MVGECVLGQENIKGEHGAQLDLTITMSFEQYGAEESTEALEAIKKK